MRITQYTDYGLRTLIYLGERPNDIVSIPQIAEHYAISLNHLIKVIYELKKMGCIESIRGRYGGLRLICSPKEINIGMVVQEMEPLDIAECFSANGQCIITSSCRLKVIFGRALHAFNQELAKYSLDDLLDNREDLVHFINSSIIPEKS